MAAAWVRKLFWLLAWVWAGLLSICAIGTVSERRWTVTLLLLLCAAASIPIARHWRRYNGIAKIARIALPVTLLICALIALELTDTKPGETTRPSSISMDAAFAFAICVAILGVFSGFLLGRRQGIVQAPADEQAKFHEPTQTAVASVKPPSVAVPPVAYLRALVPPFPRARPSFESTSAPKSKQRNATAVTFGIGDEGAAASFTYVDADGVITDRRILNWSFDGGYVRGFCTSRRAMRTFRADRMMDWQNR